MHGDESLPVWVRRSPRRALSPSGKRLVVARRRWWPHPEVWVHDQGPPAGAPARQAIWSLEIFNGPSGFVVMLPHGVAVECVALPEEDRLQVRFVFDDQTARALDLAAPEVDAVLSPGDEALRQLTKPPHPQKALPALADLLRKAGVTADGLAKLGEAHADAQHAAETARERDEDRRAAAVWKARRTRGDLGPLADDLDHAIASAGLAANAEAGFASDLTCFARLAVAAVATGPSPRARVGASRMGGSPDLRADGEWPAVDDELLTFILQVDCGALPAAARGALPAQGLLSLFVGRKESTTAVEHRLLLSPPGPLRRRRPPRGARFRDPDADRLEPIGLSLVPALSLPDCESDELAALEARYPILGTERDRYVALRAGLAPHDMVACLLGHAAGGDAASTAAGQAKAQSAHDPGAWASLLRVLSHAPAGLSFWDAGQLDVLILRAALTRGSFSDSYAQITTG
jgi:hypothetical protein